MNAQDLRDAEHLWGQLAQDQARQVAKKALASQLRATGLESTLRWLDAKSAPLRDALCETLNVPRDRAARGQRANLDVLADSRRALAVAEALHLVARAR
jgi:hypothetical protein